MQNEIVLPQQFEDLYEEIVGLISDKKTEIKNVMNIPVQRILNHN